MQERPGQARLSRALSIAVAACVAGAGSAEAALKLTKLERRVGGLPVQVHVVSEDGQGPAARWHALPSGAFPAPGKSVPVLADEYSAVAAANANFYREDQPPYQDPIGLVIHDGSVLAFPNRHYPSVGVIDGRLDWDNVTVQAVLETKVDGKAVRAPICRLNAQATKSCASIWLGRAPSDLRGVFVVESETPGLVAGRTSYRRAAKNDHSSKKIAWSVQLSDSKFAERVRELTIDTRLSGERLGDRWQGVKEAVSGSHALTPERVFPRVNRAWAEAREPRALAGVDRDGRPFVAAFDGRRENSRGISIRAAWGLLRKELGARWAVNLDGGGSTTLVHEGRLVNKPSDGSPRSIAVGWGAKN